MIGEQELEHEIKKQCLDDTELGIDECYVLLIQNEAIISGGDEWAQEVQQCLNLLIGLNLDGKGQKNCHDDRVSSSDSEKGEPEDEGYGAFYGGSVGEDEFFTLNWALVNVISRSDMENVLGKTGYYQVKETTVQATEYRGQLAIDGVVLNDSVAFPGPLKDLIYLF
ncbi:hypothetical protein K432DRAFT_424025 [Lepidopterella palustris CBS 459.81]|uniref:Uncharacterized protein n=1 Tax=Lepidopterella palustris CBS 459.81 TaxID=1314670 RepID=A0A8E2JHC2_9PEZI|nr:hypothetical protein K432DRAFT_424025 [Lepidopterella palustris CBS 459.81]